VTTKHI